MGEVAAKERAIANACYQYLASICNWAKFRNIDVF
jgi:hypothetical protein